MLSLIIGGPLITSEEIVKIIAACREAGVRKFTLGDLNLELGNAPEPIAIAAPVTSEPVTASNAEDSEDLAEENLILEDPLKYEEQFMKGN